MKICWDNLENVKLNKNGNFSKNGQTYYLKMCPGCNEEFLGQSHQKYCCKSCSSKHNNGMSNKYHSEETKQRISTKKKKYYKENDHPWLNRHHSEETKEKISRNVKKSMKNTTIWKGGYKDIPLYNTYSHQIDWCEEVRRNANDSNILEVKCAYCGRWYVPSLYSVWNRVRFLNNIKGYRSENRFYCSEGCKKECPIYRKHAYTLMKEDAIRAGRLNWIELNREVQPELRQMVLKRDRYTCQKCGNTEYLHCHHIKPVANEPIESADIDNCITYCKKCHKEVHKQDGCRQNELKMCI